MELGSMIAKSIGGYRDIVDEIFISISRILNGYISISIFYFFYNIKTFSVLISFLSELNNFKLSLLLSLVITLFAYLLGALYIVIFDFIFDLIALLLFYLKKAYFFGKIMSFFHDYFFPHDILAKGSKFLSNPYKQTLFTELNKFFNINGDQNDLMRLSKRICIDNKLLDFTRYDHYFSLFKGFCVNLGFIFVLAVLNYYWFYASLIVPIIIGIITDMKYRTLMIRTTILDAAYMYIIKNNLNHKKMSAI